MYKSLKKDSTYLFIERRDDFSAVPEPLLAAFGTPVLVTLINLANREHLAQADINKVRQQLTAQGYYLQLPPPEENLLAQHKASQQGLSS
ncbi:YcgL domain-containing protein [Rheinheimera fenheensis]|uniref:YcgL domain-containing protein n=1 Tax=Rheinheimera fenheensis TaxID=3152295 RepID=UPI00325C39FF